MKTNRLAREKSPYLLQHARNPVHWYPWCEEAFKKATDEDKPIFLSIGYSTCHWCHVMAHESFEDEEVADLLNLGFVSIKVDREERPDIDGIYMTVCQMMTGGGGWPLTIVMTPDKKPFFAATYIPKEGLFGSNGMLELLPKIMELWTDKKADVLSKADEVHRALKRRPDGHSAKEPGQEQINAAFENFVEANDEKYGGFEGAPKFPMPQNILFLLRYWKRTGEKRALAMAETNLVAMRRGGIWDHIGFGFHRYSTDEEWLVPHFEKMLYDQALLAMAYTEAFQATGKAKYRETAEMIFDYVGRELTSPEGAFYSAEDADSEGEEGKFYFWTAGELKAILGDVEHGIFSEVFNISKEGNFFDEHRARKTARNIPHLKRSLGELSPRLAMSADELGEKVEKIRKKLFDVRQGRVHPHKDDLVLSDWNGLMIAALAKAAQAFGEEKYGKRAVKAVDFILKRMKDEKGRLLHRFRDGEAAIAGNIEDHAFLIWGLIELYEATLEPRFLKEAMEHNDILLEHFWDPEKGGFFFAPDDGEKLLVRQKESIDGAMPSGNSVALHNLLRLGRMTGRSELERRAAELLRAFGEGLDQSPRGHIHFLSGLDFALGPTAEVVIAGKKEAADTEKLLERLRKGYHPAKVVLYRNIGDEDDEIVKLAPFTKEMKGADGKAAAYVCSERSCKAPTTDYTRMLELLDTPVKGR